jgi:hypothetical protein
MPVNIYLENLMSVGKRKSASYGSSFLIQLTSKLQLAEKAGVRLHQENAIGGIGLGDVWDDDLFCSRAL